MDGIHTAIIMDGNGRWAAARSLPRQEGHRAGARALRAAIEAAPRCGISTLTLYAFSSDNWKRPRVEVDALMALMRQALIGAARRCVKHGIRLSAIGRRDRLPATRWSKPPGPVPPVAKRSPAASARPMSICSFAPAASSASAIFCSGNAPTPSSTFRPSPGLTSVPRI